MNPSHIPSNINYKKKSKLLVLSYGGNQPMEYSLPAEYLRVHSPSAEVQGHGVGAEVLQFGKRDVEIQQIVPVGNYAVQLHFDDGHNSGLYSWAYLYELSVEQAEKWQDYLARLAEAGQSRDADTQVIRLGN
ncbi:hypothetical protein SIN8267_01957 [Sinobacterium norvegicum]|uniref:Gamma-butyrobetaine hydroxylase-like N-terminal domain-containing protein n=1 Tax=Sinobacterium norvegicum TaxID=1641715 RepID=A0ABN8EKC9_9GAMM|nr:DUF971 domain-containing protein [Sinobacterium norvegicum]CAH0991842.1 hypothetical protein SIN8267_01957 [Sinobacterium norvegicum]